MVTVFWALCVVLGFMLLAKFRAAAMVAAVFVLFGLVTRTAALTYVDLLGPVFSEQLDKDIGGSEASMPLFALSVLVFLFALAVMFRPFKLQKSLPLPVSVSPNAVALGNIVFFSSLLFIFLLYGDMLRRGVIPLFENMERFDYANLYAGPFHSIIFEYGFLLAGFLGAFFVYPRLTGQGYKYRFVGLVLLLFGYFVLTGHRFSAFFSFGSFFLLPLSAIFVLKNISALQPIPATQSFVQKVLARKSIWFFMLTGLFSVLSAVMLNSLTNVREYDDPLEKLLQRVFIQPVELWWETWNRVVVQGEWAPSLAWNLMFNDPLDASRNTGVQFLMVKALGYARTEELLTHGSQYAGGYPEVLFELGGPYAALPLALLFGLTTALLLRTIVVAVCRGNFGTVFMGIYVYYGFSLLYIGGMLNFLIATTFMLKVGVLILVYWLESNSYYRRRRRFMKFSNNNSKVAED